MGVGVAVGSGVGVGVGVGVFVGVGVGVLVGVGVIVGVGVGGANSPDPPWALATAWRQMVKIPKDRSETRKQPASFLTICLYYHKLIKSLNEVNF